MYTLTLTHMRTRRKKGFDLVPLQGIKKTCKGREAKEYDAIGKDCDFVG